MLWIFWKGNRYINLQLQYNQIFGVNEFVGLLILYINSLNANIAEFGTFLKISFLLIVDAHHLQAGRNISWQGFHIIERVSIRQTYEQLLSFKVVKL